MAEYIEREAVLASIKNLKHYLNTGIARHNLTQKDIMRVLETFPKADVVEVVHGRWIDRSDKGVISLTHPYVCNRCGRVEMLKEPYCNCGARMDGDTDA